MADKRDVRSALRAYEQPSMLQGAWDEISGAFARYGRRSGAQRDASLALMSQAADPNTDPLTGAGMKALGLAGLVTHPLAFFPTGDEWRERTRNAGNTGRMGQAIGGMLGDLPSLIDPQMAAGGAALAAAPIVGKLGRGLGDLAGDATDAELAALRARLQAEAAPKTRKEVLTQSYKETLPDGTERWVPGTLRANPTTAPRFEPSMSIADIRRYIEQFGEPPPTRAKGEIVTGKRKDVYPDGTVTPVPGLLRTKRPPSLGEALQGSVGGGDEGIIAYHGSPHSFDKFDVSKIGTGEGAQAYGHGLYFAEAEDVAKTYRDMLSDQPLAVPAIGWQQRMDWTEAQDDAYGLVDKALEELQIDIAQGGSTRPNWSGVIDKVRQLAPRGKEDEIVRELAVMADKYGWKEFVNKNPGSMYQVKINVKPDELLDWDKPLSEQPESVRGILKGQPEVQRKIDAMRRIVGDKAENMSGQSAYAALASWKQGADLSPTGEAAVATSQKLKAAGIKGIRYKDAGSRGADGGTYNYVVFDDRLITILKKYGIPMTAGAGGAMMVAGQDMPPDIASQMGGT